ncbi:diacylglycerol/lipid kinase family protein [Lacinutrix chionoecetis]
MDALKWFVIINPQSGNGTALKRWPTIQKLLNASHFNYKFAFTKYKWHSTELVTTAISQGFKNIICVGGDGTLHAIVNGIMHQNIEACSKIQVGVIPIGTGNDWAKHYNIPNRMEDAISLIKKNRIYKQDLGKIEFLDSNNPPVYFNNIAGIGFDGLVSKKTEKLKRLGRLSYFIAACQALVSLSNFEIYISSDKEEFNTKSMMVIVGLCKYSGGGMQLTSDPDPKDGLLDVTNVANFNVWDFIKNLPKLYNGRVHKASKISTFKTKRLTLQIAQEEGFYMQADGEVFNAETIRISLLKNTFSFYG